MRANAAATLMLAFRIVPTLLGVAYGLADLALCVWLIANGEWGWLVVAVILTPLIATIGLWITAALAMPFYGLARLFDRETADAILEGMEA